ESRAGIQRMKFFLCLCVTFIAITAHAEKITLVNGTLVNPANAEVIPLAQVVVDGNRIIAAGSGIDTKSPAGARVIDCKGKFILPGYIDTHVHFFQSADLFT